MEIHKYEPEPPTLKGLPKIHKPNIPIRPIVNWKNAPAFHLAKLVTDVLNKDIPLPNTFNIKNSTQLMIDLNEIPITQHLHLASFDIKDMYTSIPTKNLPRILNLICNQTLVPKKFQQQLTAMLRTILKQNYFQYNSHIYKQKSGLAMGAPSSSILSELYLQYTEHTVIIDILLKYDILGYFRYVDDILLVYDTTKTNIQDVLNDFNNSAHPLNFTFEDEIDNHINFLDIIPSKKTPTPYNTRSTENQQTQTSSFHQTPTTQWNIN